MRQNDEYSGEFPCFRGFVVCRRNEAQSTVGLCEATVQYGGPSPARPIKLTKTHNRPIDN